MKTIEINGSVRTELGKKNSKKLRMAGNVPCVIYGKNDNVHFYTHENSFLNLVYTPDSHLVNLNLDDKKYNLIVKDVQFHPVTDKIIHADFLEISDDKKIKISLPVKISGDSIGVKAGGKLRIKRRHLNVKGYVKDIPEFIPIDITNVKINHSIKVSDISVPDIEITDPKITTIVTVASSRVVLKEEGEAAAETPEAEATPADTHSEEKS
ncbi:MAG TPA: 50S ribosomal protein L25/general stress protein Ctc [Bacteroidales bacterium]|jgi:large subunit ribosomal protein L25|nr:50S ribosomal protein L25/general stress protein Ctc [Bacteroidales bacterium]